MGVIVKLDDEGRITLPAEALSALGLAPGDEVEVVIDGGREVILRRPRLPLSSFVGILRYDGPPVSIEEMDEGIMDAVMERHERSRGGA